MGVYESMILADMDRLKIKTSFTAALAVTFSIPGASEASLSKSFNNVKELSTVETAAPLSSVLRRFVKMAEALAPLKLRFDDPAEAKRWLEDFESGALIVSVLRRDANGTRPVPFTVILIGPALFKRIGSSGQVETTTSYGDCAAFGDFFVAHTAAKLLDRMGQFQVRATTISNMRRPPETISDRLIDFGLVEKIAAELDREAMRDA